MSVIKIPIIMFLLALKMYLIEAQWNQRSCNPKQGFNAQPTIKLPVKYVPAQPIANQVNNYPYPEPNPQSLSAPYPNALYHDAPYPNVAPPYPPYPYNNPGSVTIPPSCPGQPVIVINNGGGDGPGGGGDDFDIGELLTLMLAFNGGGLLGGHHGHGHGHGSPKQEPAKEEPDDPPMFPPWYYGYPGFYPGMNGCYPGFPGYPGFPDTGTDDYEDFKPFRGKSNKSGDSINITIVLPNNSSGPASVQIDTKDKNEDNKKCEVDLHECDKE